MMMMSEQDTQYTEQSKPNKCKLIFFLCINSTCRPALNLTYPLLPSFAAHSPFLLGAFFNSRLMLTDDAVDEL